jgi:hypothetical protein
MKENVMKSTRLFKQAFILATVSSLAFTSATFAMENEKKNPNHPTITQKSDEWNEAVKEKNLTKLQDLCQKGLTKTTQTNVKEEDNFEKLIWENRSERLTQVQFADRKEGEEIDYSPLIDYFEDPISSNNTFPTVTNPQLLKGEEEISEPYPQINFISLENKEKKTTVNTNLYLTVNNTNVTTNTQLFQELKIEDKPQKTAKQLWDEINENTRTTRFNLVLSGLWDRYNEGLLPPVAENKEKGTFEGKSKGVRLTINLTEVNKELSKHVGKDQYMYQYAIKELDEVFNQRVRLSIENLPDPCSIGGKQFAKTYNIPENYQWSKLYYYREHLLHPSTGVVAQIINDIVTGKSELK